MTEPTDQFPFPKNKAYIGTELKPVKTGGKVSILTKIKNYFLSLPVKPFDLIIFLVFALVTLKVASLYFDVENEDKDWEKFSQANNCKPKMGNNGYESSTWTCDDGKVQYRWRQQK